MACVWDSASVYRRAKVAYAETGKTEALHEALSVHLVLDMQTVVWRRRSYEMHQHEQRQRGLREARRIVSSQ